MQSIDKLCTYLEEETNWSPMTSEKYYRFRIHFTNALNKIGARREPYYDRQLSVQPCESFIEHVPTFCRLLCTDNVENSESVLSLCITDDEVQRGLLKLISMHIGESTLSKPGLQFFIKYQRKWTQSILIEFKSLSLEFCREIMTRIGIP